MKDTVSSTIDLGPCQCGGQLMIREGTLHWLILGCRVCDARYQVFFRCVLGKQVSP